MLRKTIIGLLIFNAISGCFGGAVLILSPDGSLVQMPMEWLDFTPFNSYLIPGIVLLLCNGLLPILVCAKIIGNSGHAHQWLKVQGVMSIGWIVVQIIMIQQLHWLQLLYGSIGFMYLIAAYFFQPESYARE